VERNSSNFSITFLVLLPNERAKARMHKRWTDSQISNRVNAAIACVSKSLRVLVTDFDNNNLWRKCCREYGRFAFRFLNLYLCCLHQATVVHYFAQLFVIRSHTTVPVASVPPIIPAHV